MQDEFIALRVPEGDAFFLKRHEDTGVRRILIDGGAGLKAKYWKYYHAPRESFDQLFIREIGLRPRDSSWDVDVMVCTHNDRDHTEGLIEFFRGGLKAQEVWLPGSFASIIHRFASDPTGALARLAEEVTAIPKEDLAAMKVKAAEQDVSLLDVVAQTLPELESWVKTTEGQSLEMNLYANEPLERISDLLSITAPDLVYTTARYWFDPFYLGRLWHRQSDMLALRSDPLYLELFVSLMELGARVVALSALARQSGATLRWFEFEKKGTPNSLDGEPYLRPLNARELKVVPSSPGPLLLSLSVPNKESLVFHAPATEQNLAVLFSADSNFDFGGTVPWSADMLITAPHHGARVNNRLAARFVIASVRGTVWVRSDGALATQPSPVGAWVRPTPWYINLKGNASLFCTHCNDATTRQTVRLKSVTSSWQPQLATQTCQCS